MHRTIFKTPIINTLLRHLSIIFLRLSGWKIEGQLPAEASKCVFIAASHTSNWDLPYTLMVAFTLRLNIYWMGKTSIFQFPFDSVMRWLGGIAVNREQSNNLVAVSAQTLIKADGPVQLVIPPEGTRSKTCYWKTGFYYIALEAKVPILMAYVDYSRKISGIGPLLIPTGNIENDMQVVKNFYASCKGKNADQFLVTSKDSIKNFHADKPHTD
jgi:1-acyl-sn-glycerol-3-phosphate acyltransferase